MGIAPPAGIQMGSELLQWNWLRANSHCHQREHRQLSCSCRILQKASDTPFRALVFKFGGCSRGIGRWLSLKSRPEIIIVL
jgi:hypothetical protein